MPYGPCCLCGATNYPNSLGGPHICPSCDCGNPPQPGTPYGPPGGSISLTKTQGGWQPLFPSLALDEISPELANLQLEMEQASREKAEVSARLWKALAKKLYLERKKT